MITEEEILQKIEDTWVVLKQYRAQYFKQKPFEDELLTFLLDAYQEDPQLMVNLFWKYFDSPKSISNSPESKKAPYVVYLFSAIVEYPDPLSIEMACQLLVHSDSSYDEDSARFLYDAKDPVAVPYLIEALKSDDYGVVREAALALGNIGDSRAEPHLLEIVEMYDNDEVYSDDRIDDAYPIIRYNTFIALCLLNTPTSNEKIIESVFGDRDKGIQQQALRHLIIVKPDVAMPYIEELMITQPETISSLVSRVPGASIPYFEKLLEHEDLKIVLLAKKYLGRATVYNLVNSKPQEATTILESLSEHPDREVAVFAREYLNELQS